jgi:hypothetical protein
MDNYFKQIPIDIDLLDVSKFNLTPKRSFNDQNYYSNINNIEYTNYLNNIFKKLNPIDVFYCEFPGNWPHIDHDGSQCAINHYYVTQNVETIYYKAKPNAKSFHVPKEDDANLYHKKDIIKEVSFCAEPNSVWLLDVTKIHGVGFPNKKFGGLRTFIKWRFDAPYEEIYRRLFDEVLPKL